MSEFKYSERIDAYLEGEMNEAERLSFEQDLLVNETLRVEFDACKAAQQATELIAFKGMMKRFEESKKDSSKHVWYSSGPRTWAVAAAVLVLGVVSIVLWANLKYSNGNLSKQFFKEAYPNFSGVRSKDSIIAPFDQAKIAFEKGDFQSAINSANNITNDKNDFAAAQFLIGCAWLELGDGKKAVVAFQNVVPTENEYSNRAAYFIALAHLKSGNLEATKSQLLQIISNPKQPYQEESQILLNQLNTVWHSLTW